MDHVATVDGGLGFCGQSIGPLMPNGMHGPLVIALDSNILIDIESWGDEMFNDKLPATMEQTNPRYYRDLLALTYLLELWMLRDIRFIVTTRTVTDARRGRSLEQDRRRMSTIDAIARSLAFQTGDWENILLAANAPGSNPAVVEGIPSGADADLVAEAHAERAHVFLTRDRRVLEHATVTQGRSHMVIANPTKVGETLSAQRVTLFSGGTCGTPHCPYFEWSYPGPDTGRWSGLLSAINSQ